MSFDGDAESARLGAVNRTHEFGFGSFKKREKSPPQTNFLFVLSVIFFLIAEFN